MQVDKSPNSVTEFCKVNTDDQKFSQVTCKIMKAAYKEAFEIRFRFLQYNPRIRPVQEGKIPGVSPLLSRRCIISSDELSGQIDAHGSVDSLWFLGSSVVRT